MLLNKSVSEWNVDVILVNVLSNDDRLDYSLKSWWLGLLVDRLLLGKCCGKPVSHLLLPHVL